MQLLKEKGFPEGDFVVTKWTPREEEEEEKEKSELNKLYDEEEPISVEYQIQIDTSGEEVPKEIKELGEYLTIYLSPVIFQRLTRFLEKTGADLVELFELSGKQREADNLQEKLYNAQVLETLWGFS